MTINPLFQPDIRKSNKFPKDNTSTSAYGAKSLCDMAQKQVLQQLKTLVTGYQDIANYCCGGLIPISSDPVRSNGFQTTLSAPVLRWEIPGKPGVSRSLQFPLSEEGDNTLLDELLAACNLQPNDSCGDDVLRDDNRKERTLDASQFRITFQPEDCGIIDTIGQLLLTLLPCKISLVPFSWTSPKGRILARAQHLQVSPFSHSWGHKLTHLMKVGSKTSKGFEETPSHLEDNTLFGHLIVYLPASHEGNLIRTTPTEPLE
jgi:hypothetical protein